MTITTDTGEVEATLERVSKHEGVVGCIVLSSEGVVLRSTCEAELAEQHAHIIPELAIMARNMVRDLDPQDELKFLRVRSNKQEIMIAPHSTFILIVIQTITTKG